MKRYVYILLLIWCIPTQAQLLYEISGNSAKGKSYLFATNRLCDITLLDSVPNLFKVFGQCNKVITEMAMQDYEAIAALRQAALLPDSVQLRNYYSAEEYKTIDEALSISIGMGLEQLGRMQPAYLTELYRNELIQKWIEKDENRSIDVFFQAIAEERGMPVYALDEIGETLYMLFEREPFHWQCKELLNIVNYPEREIRLEKEILQNYRNGHLNQTAYLISMPDNLSTHSYSDYQVYAQRNQVWAKRLAQYLTEGSAFICLDAVYLGGDKGLIAKLKEEGYRVRAVNRR